MSHLHTAVRQVRTLIALAWLPDREYHLDAAEAIGKIRALGATPAQWRDALYAAMYLHLFGAVGMANIICRIAATGRLDGLDLDQLQRRHNIQIAIPPETLRAMADAAERESS